ncbi:glycoside hydrolase family 9 protein [Flexithrix dorotheae]|uniref:glycoside hydrolase family 9 protein n=1 Tax=Flexithrix dorotheae TaxID=70993 RepID=UPI00036DD99D|nr:glycoside hydrolase family 9 protein [Flexithrix dorotheae]
MKNRPNVFLNHVGFLCDARKIVTIEDCEATEFTIQNMSLHTAESLGGYENWQTVYTGPLKKVQNHLGTFLQGDFTDFTQPGLFRIFLPDGIGHSYQFLITDGAFSRLPRLFLDHIHNWRSGNFENEWRGPINADDGIRSDNGEYIDASGGWNDAGDLRKWMTMTNLPAIGFLDIHERLGLKWNHFAEENVTDNDLITETIWGVKFILKMQDPDTGMIFEELGAGGEGRKQPGMSWWYENHSGCYADNSQNHFTDNKVQSGDERRVRVQYNPIVQYINSYILLRAAKALKAYDPELAETCIKAAFRVWDFIQTKKDEDPLHTWTSVRSWRLCAGIEFHLAGKIPMEEVTVMLDELIDLQSEEYGFWFMDAKKDDPYRAILHSAQPIIGQAQFMEYFPDHPVVEKCRKSILICWEKYVQYITKTNPFGIIPLGCYFKPATEIDVYRDLDNGLKFRFYLPPNSPQRITHGLAGHWTSWSHGLALAGKVLGDNEMTQASWDQLYWLLGNNQLNSCLVSGIGYNTPMPHSRFLGTDVGGFCVGPRGEEEDEIFIDMDARADWSSTEYWNCPLSNTLMAFSILLPKEIKTERKVGYIG